MIPQTQLYKELHRHGFPQIRLKQQPDQLQILALQIKACPVKVWCDQTYPFGHRPKVMLLCKANGGKISSIVNNYITKNKFYSPIVKVLNTVPTTANNKIVPR